jgi:hypothetical protein
MNSSPRWKSPSAGSLNVAGASCSGVRPTRCSLQDARASVVTRTAEDDPAAPFYNDTTMYVVSSTLTTATCRNSRIIGPGRRADATRRPAGGVNVADLVLQVERRDSLGEEPRPGPAGKRYDPTRSVREHRPDQRGARSLEVDRLPAARSVPDGPAADSSHDER